MFAMKSGVKCLKALGLSACLHGEWHNPFVAVVAVCAGAAELGGARQGCSTHRILLFVPVMASPDTAPAHAGCAGPRGSPDGNFSLE